MKKLIYIVVVFLALSCQKNTFEDVSQKSNSFPVVQNVETKDGRLIFKSRHDFDKVMKTLFETQKSIKNFEDQFSGFTSNKQAFEKIDSTFLRSIDYNFDLISNYAILLETPEGKSLERVVDIHLLSFLFNDDGILQIGDSIFKFSYDFTYKFNVDKLSQLKSAKLTGSTNDVIAYPNIRSRVELPTNRLKSAQASVSEKYHWYTSSRFIKCELNQNITFLHNALTVDTKSRMKTAGIGFAYKVDQLYCGAVGYWYWEGLDDMIRFAFDVSDFKSGGVTDVQQTITYNPGPGVPAFVSGTTTGTHWFKYSSAFPIEYINPGTSY